MIYITGDTHGTIDFAKLLDNDYRTLNKDDYVIICGDCGVVFERDSSRIINLYQYLPFTVLFVDGNHENFDSLNDLPVDVWNGGKIHKVSDSVFHLMRGQVYEIDHMRFFTFGGALSLDRSGRIPGVSWWPQESPTEEDYTEATSNLEKCGYCVDYVITHDCPLSWMGSVKSSMKIFHEGYNEAPSNIYLDKLLKKLRFKHWFFGHYHIDTSVDTYATVLFNRVIPIDSFMNLGYTHGEMVSGDYSAHCISKSPYSSKVILLGDSTCAHHSDKHPYSDDWWSIVCRALNSSLVFNKSAYDLLKDNTVDLLINQRPLSNSSEYLVIISTGTDALLHRLQVTQFCDYLEKLSCLIDQILPLANVIVLGIPKQGQNALSANAASIYNEAMLATSTAHEYLYIPLDGFDDDDFNEYGYYTSEGSLKTARIICQHIAP